MIPLPELTPEERAAMDAPPPDFIRRTLAGERPLLPRAPMAKPFAGGDPLGGDDWRAMQLLRAILEADPDKESA